MQPIPMGASRHATLRGAWPVARVAALLLAATLTSFGVREAAAQPAPFPTRPVTIVVPFAAGGPTDLVARQIAQAMSNALGQGVVVENRPSAGGIVGSEAVARAAPDGYLLLIHNIGMATSPALYRQLRFDPLSDFEHVGQIVDVPMTLIGRKGLTADGYPALAAHIAAQRDKVTLAHAGPGTASHLCGLLLMSRLGIALTTVGYKGAAPALTDLQGGQVDLLCDQSTTTTQVIATGRVQAYGATTRAPIAVLPNLPTLGAQGLERFEIAVWHGLYAPKGTPAAVIERLSRALQDGLADAGFRQAMARLGTQVVTPDKATPQGLREHLAAEIARWTPIIREARQFAD